jgi:Gram-negative bacterial TonB protein C-terminal
VSPTLQLEEELVRLPDAPQFLVEWSPRWQGFVTSIRPALARSAPRLAGEAPLGGAPLRGMVSSMLIEAFFIFVVIVLPIKIAQLRPYAAPKIGSHDVIYYSGDELPRIEDLGGTQAGRNGRAGGDEAHHRTQTIKIARGASLVPKVVDAPNLKLPSSRDAVANLLAVKPNPGPPPLEGMRSSRRAPDLSSAIVAPAPNVIRDYTRNSPSLNADAVVAPAPTLSSNQLRNTPTLNAAVIAPAPNLSRDRTLVAPVLGSAVIPPAPRLARDHNRAAPSLTANVVAPAPSVTRDNTRSAPVLNAGVIAPAPSAVSRELSSAPVQMTNVSVVPPPVSSPERATNRNSKLTLPAPSVIAPPPSSDVSQDMRRLASGSVSDPARAVVPPPPTQPTGFMSSLIGKIFGPSEAVPPPPTVTSNGTTSSGRSTLASNVVPPPPSVATGSTSKNPRGSRSGAGTILGSNVVAPPPAVTTSSNIGGRSGSAATSLNANVVAPPPSLSGASGERSGSPDGTTLATNVVPPPPSLGGGSSDSGSGVGRKGTGLGAPLDPGSALAPAVNGGSGNHAGAVISSDPGSKVGLPTIGGTGSLSMSPSGGDKTGLGGAGGGTSIGRGDGSGSGMKSSGTAAANSGPGRGADPAARGGISPSPGPGGAGTAPGGTPPVPGVSVSGGSTIVTLPSFGSDSSSPTSQTPGRSSAKGSTTLGVTVVATASSGGAFEPYKNLLRGEKYTTYVDTSLGPVVMEFADENTAAHSFGATLTGPQAIRTDLPDGLPHARLSIKCTLDTSGNLKNLHIIDAGPAEMTAKVVAAIRSWKFQPAMRGNQPVEVTAILGFGINTDDRF